MRRRPDPDAVSPRARARLRGTRPGRGWVPTAAEVGRGAVEDDDRLDVDGIDVGGGAGRTGLLAGGRHAWVRAPTAFVGARWQPGRAAVAGVVLVTVVAVLVLGLRVAWARSDPGDVVAPGAGAVGVSAGAEPVGVPPSAEPLPVGSAGASVAPTPSGSASPVGELVVHVVGQVAHPGVRRLPVGSRVADAVEAAGGARPGADLAAVNLARLLVDGEQVRVPKPGEEVVAPPAAPGVGGDATSGGSSGTGAGGGAGPVSVNTADVAALDTLPGIGPVLAQRIVDWRSENGRFTSVDELAEVSGIGEKLLAQLRPLVTT